MRPRRFLYQTHTMTDCPQEYVILSTSFHRDEVQFLFVTCSICGKSCITISLISAYLSIRTYIVIERQYSFCYHSINKRNQRRIGHEKQ